jgi:ubiquitin C
LSIHIELSNGERTEVNAGPAETLASLKRKIKNQTGIPEESQSLYFGGLKLNETVRLWNFPIQNGVTFHLSIASLITIRTLSGQESHVNYSSTDTVAALKLTVEAETGIPPERQRLIWSGRYLEDERLLSDY